MSTWSHLALTWYTVIRSQVERSRTSVQNFNQNHYNFVCYPYVEHCDLQFMAEIQIKSYTNKGHSIDW